jgi:hypothetical protein
VATWHRQNSEILSSRDNLWQKLIPEGTMYDAGLAERLHDHIGGMFEMELTTMFGGYGFLMNGHMCVFIWGDRLRGWAAIFHEGVAEDSALQRYVDMAIMFCATLPPKEAKPKVRGSRKTTRKPN